MCFHHYRTQTDDPDGTERITGGDGRDRERILRRLGGAAGPPWRVGIRQRDEEPVHLGAGRRAEPDQREEETDNDK